MRTVVTENLTFTLQAIVPAICYGKCSITFDMAHRPHICRQTFRILDLVSFLLHNKNITYKVKAIPVQARTSPEGSKKLRLPNFMTIGT